VKRQFDTKQKLYTLSLLVEDVPGVLSQVARLFSRKGYNIESIVSGETDRPGITRITISIIGDELMVDQIAAQCRKLIPVEAVKIMDEETSIRREMALIKVRAADRTARDEVIQMVNIFRGNIIDVSHESLTIGIFG
jgi:acetolactate synthase-1/3 small subunit